MLDIKELQKQKLAKMQVVDLSNNVLVDSYFDEYDFETMALSLLYWAKRDNKIYQYAFKDYLKIEKTPFDNVKEIVKDYNENSFEKSSVSLTNLKFKKQELLEHISDLDKLNNMQKEKLFSQQKKFTQENIEMIK